MLKRLSVENYVLIDRLELELAAGLNIITGETGAGKSILLGALSLLLGAKAEGGVMRDQERNCVIEGQFEIDGYGLKGFFSENDLDYDSRTTIRRVISPGGKSRAYINDLPVQLGALKELGGRLIDIHSQHQSLMLASDAFRCGILDSVAANGPLLTRYGEAYDALRKATAELARLRAEAEQNAREQEYLRFQSEQIAAAGLREGEQQELEEEQDELSHAGQIREALEHSGEMLTQEETGILPRLKNATQSIRAAAAYYPRAEELHRRLASAYEELRDVEREIASGTQRVESDPAKLARIDERLALIYSLQKKHGVQSLEALIALGAEYAARLEEIVTAGEQIAALEARTETLRAAARKLALELSARRSKAAVEVKKHVERLLAALGMPGATFTAEVADGGELRPTGSDATRFLFSANPNAPAQPVEKVASGGEISRLMLALKSLVAERSMLPTIIFDEIDTGVSGRIADAMGGIICSIARNMQVINITHLPQVASKGQTHFVVYKEHAAGGARTALRLLDRQQRVEEIAKMLSGSLVTEAALAQARILLGE